MRNLRNTKEDFVKGVVERVKNGSWGLTEIDYLTEHHSKYHLNYEDIGHFLSQVFDYTYSLAMEDGLVSEAENVQLANMKALTMSRVPRNKSEREELRLFIIELSNRFVRTHAMQEQLKAEAELAPEVVVPPPETVKERVNNIYYKYPRPKLTPYTSW